MLEVMSGTDLRPIDKTLIHSSGWGYDQSSYFQLNGIYEPNIPGPHGQKHTLRSISVGGNGWMGGWNSAFIQVDNTKKHRVSTLVNIKNKGGAIQSSLERGYIYLGVNNAPDPLQNSNTGVGDTNPYFHVTQVELLPEDEWLLLVGYVFPVNTPNQPISTDAGVYIVSTKDLLYQTTSEYRFTLSTNTLQHRCYHYYDQIPGIDVLYNDPRIDVCDGSEPTISQLLNGYGVNMRKRPIIT
jgi:hypothetical protein